MEEKFELDVAQALRNCMSSLISEYNLRCIPVDNDDAILLGAKYALHFVWEKEGMEVSYIERGCGNQLSEYTLRHLVIQRFLATDWMLHGNPVLRNERLNAAARVYASGLSTRCRDVLCGETDWLKREAWSAGRPSSKVLNAINSN